MKSRKKSKKNILIPRKTMKCSPMTISSKFIKHSCYSPEILYKIRNAYNKSHPEQKINTRKPNKLYWELAKNLRTTCDREDCWLKLLPTEQQDYLDQYIFAPNHPNIWKSNPDEWLSNYDIINVLHQYEIEYPCFKLLGPSAIDFDTRLNNRECVESQLCNFNIQNYIKKGFTKIGISFNLDKHDGPGFHWVSLFIDIKQKLMFYFDSAMYKTPPEITTFVNRVLEQSEKYNLGIQFEQNKVQHQFGSSECGMYSLFFIITMLTEKWGGKGKKLNIADRIHLFKDKSISDQTVFQFRKEYFNEP